MPRRKGHGGHTSRESPERETKEKHVESEPEGSMGDNNEVIYISNYWVRRQKYTTKFQHQSLEEFS
jgi:hypothetical protein